MTRNGMSQRSAARQTTVLEPFYRLRDRAQVLGFIQQHTFLVPLLLEASEPLRKYFPGSEAFLEVVTDPEVIGDRELVVSVLTDLDPGEAVPKLKRFDKDWWLNSSDRAQGKLCITLEYR